MQNVASTENNTKRSYVPRVRTDANSFHNNKYRRLNYFMDILTREKKDMLHNFILTQWYKPNKGYWTEQVKRDLIDLDLPDSLKEILKNKFSLVQLKNKHSKMKNLQYTELNTQDY